MPPKVRPSYLELGLILVTGLIHVSIEIATDGGGAHMSMATTLYNVVVIIAWSAYVLWRGVTMPALWRAWGFRLDNVRATLRVSIPIALAAACLLLAYGAAQDRLVWPATVWAVLGLYPLYGIAQQFALQVLVARNLRLLVPSRRWRVCCAALVFSVAHAPNYPLMALTLAAGVAFTWIYEAHPNLWVIGVIHGVLGALAYHLVLGIDPIARWLSALQYG